MTSVTKHVLHTDAAVHLILGPMFAAKTTELLTWVDKAAIARRRCLLVKYAGDTRYTDRAELATHAGVRVQARDYVDVAVAGRLAEVDAAQHALVAVDEGQFFPDLAAGCDEWARQGKTVVVAALDGDFRRQMFPQVAALVPLCDTVVKHNAICMHCRSRTAPFTARLNRETAQVCIGGADRYRALCRSCFERRPSRLEELGGSAQAYARRLADLAKALRSHALTRGNRTRRILNDYLVLLNSAMPQSDGERAAEPLLRGLSEPPVLLQEPAQVGKELALPPEFRLARTGRRWRLNDTGGKSVVPPASV